MNVNVELTLDELIAIQEALEAVDAEYGFSVYKNAHLIPTGSHGPRTPKEHAEAADEGQRLLYFLDDVIDSLERP